VEVAEGNGARPQVRRTGALIYVRYGRDVLEVGEVEEFEEFGRVSGRGVSQNEAKGGLPDVDPQAPAAAGEEATERSGLGKGELVKLARSDGAHSIGQPGHGGSSSFEV
jgi:hypothetical protein